MSIGRRKQKTYKVTQMWKIKCVNKDKEEFAQIVLDIEKAKSILHSVRLLGGDGFVMRMR